MASVVFRYIPGHIRVTNARFWEWPCSGRSERLCSEPGPVSVTWLESELL